MMKMIKELIKKILRPIKVQLVKFFKIVLKDVIYTHIEINPDVKKIYQEIENTQDLIIYGINNSNFRIQEYEDAYLEMAEILKKHSINFSLYYGSLLSVVRNGYLDPNVMDIDYIVTSKELQLIGHIFEKNKEFQIFHVFIQEEAPFLIQLYDCKRNIAMDFYSIDSNGFSILPEHGKHIKDEPLSDNGIEMIKRLYFDCQLYDAKEFFKGIKYQDFKNPHTGSVINFPILISSAQYLYKIYGEDWMIRKNIYKKFYANNPNEDRKQRGALVSTTQKGDRNYKNIHSFLNAPLASYIYGHILLKNQC